MTLSSQLTGELASVQAVTIGDAGDADAADAAGEAAHGEEEIIPGMLR